MRKFCVLLFCCLAFTCYSQKKVPTVPPCATDELMEKMIKDYPGMRERLEQIDNEANNFLSTRRSSTFPLINIPVVVYVVHDNQPLGTGTNINDGQVNSQIDALNDYFEPLNIKFCLAKRAGENSTTVPVNNTTTDVQYQSGIIHVNRPDLVNNFYTDEAALAATAHPLITKQRYLRIWVVKSIQGNGQQKGYAYFPGNPSVLDGVVIRSDVFGKAGIGCTCNLDPSFLQGTTLVHEIGHYLGLYHTFFEGCTELTTGTCNTRGDRICDTPPVAAANYYCTAGADTCAGDSMQDANHNYMDYGIDCAYEFSLGQMQKIFSTLSLSRHELVTTQNTFYTGSCDYENMLFSDFTASNFSPCSSSTDPIVFTATTMSTPVTYSWDFGDGSSVVNTALPTVNHLFTTASATPYTVTLTVTNTTTLETVSSSELIYVTACGAPASNAYTRWYVPHSGMLEFDSGVAKYNTSFPENAFTDGACAIQNDANGVLMFYTNKSYIYNSSHVVTNPNNPLVPDFNEYHRYNSVVIVPKPGTAQYYIFTNTNTLNGPNSENGFRYTIVNANGTLTSTIKQPVTTPAGYDVSTDGAVTGGNGITVVKKCDGYWILTNITKTTAGGYNHYLVVYSLTSTGLTYRSIINLQGAVVTPDTGYVKASPNGNRIFNTRFYNGYIFDFNKVTGQLSNPIILNDAYTLYGGEGAAFSPDSKRLYLNEALEIDQYNLDAIDVEATKKELISITGTQRHFGAIQAGPDKKLYISLADVDYSDGMENSREMAIIHKPNALVTADNLNACYFSMHGPKKTFGNRGLGWELPNMLDATAAAAYDNTIYYYPSGCGKFRFFPNVCGVEQFKWEFKNLGTNATTILPPSPNFPEFSFAPGDYSVKAMDSNNNVLVTISHFTVTGMATPVILGNDQACAVTGGSTANSVVLGDDQQAVWTITSGAGQISGNADQADVTVYWTQLPGTISVTVTNAEGCQRTVSKTITSSCVSNGANNTVYTVTRPLSASTTIFGGEFTAYDGVPVNRIARIDNNLSLDPTFNVGTGANNTVYATALQNNLKVLIGGTFTQFNGTSVNGIARLNNDGSLDGTFTGTGVTSPGSSPVVRAINALGNTKIMIAGNFEYYNGTAIRNVARLLSTGALDSSFTPAFPVNSSVNCIAVQIDGKMILGGSFTLYGSTPVGNIVRLNTDGSIDSSFATNTGTGFSDVVSAIKIQPDGKILVGGNFLTFNGVSRTRFARLTASGTLDTAFAPPAFPITGNSPFGVLAIDLQSNNKIIVGGTFMTAGAYNRNGITRLNTTGSVDTSYNPGTGFTYPSDGRGNKIGIVFALAVQSDDRIITGGSFTKYNDIGVNNITRINPTGNVVGRPAAESQQIALQPDVMVYVYPNPVSDNLTIVTNGGASVDNVEIYNALGQRVKTLQLPKGVDTINVSELSSGSYTLKLLKGRLLLKTEKIIKK